MANEDRVDQLELISKQLEAILGSQNKGISSASFWIGVGLTIATMLASIFLAFGGLRSDVRNHINNKAIHLSEEQVRQIILNNEFRLEMRKKLDEIYAKKTELLKLEQRITKLEAKND